MTTMSEHKALNDWAASHLDLILANNERLQVSKLRANWALE